MKPIFKTTQGESYCEDSLKLITSKKFLNKYENKINLIFTSPPFTLITPKSYGNLNGDEYIEWLSEYAIPLTKLLTDNGSIVIELGNTWNPKEPTFSTTPIEALLKFKTTANLFLCQELICHNTSRLPGPAPYVTTKRIRLKDSYTRLWWLSKSPYPKSDNRNILLEYSKGMQKLIATGQYNRGIRPSGHNVGEHFGKNNKGSISANFIDIMDSKFLFENSSIGLANTSSQPEYSAFCRENKLPIHPARMQMKLAEIMIQFLTDEGDLVFDPFSGSNTTGCMAEKHNRRWVTSELNMEYIKGSTIRFFNQKDSLAILQGQ
jgi:site-specific DNA-methyltransferase (cytosine-N4-specific)